MLPKWISMLKCFFLSMCVCVCVWLCVSVVFTVSVCQLSVGGEVNLMISCCGWCSLTAGESSGDAVGFLLEQRHVQIISPAAFICCCTYCCIISLSSLPPLPPPHRAASSHFPPSLSSLTTILSSPSCPHHSPFLLLPNHSRQWPFCCIQLELIKNKI